MSPLESIDTIAVLMLENRSFDHVLGHLSLPPWSNGTRVDGLTTPLEHPRYENIYQGQPYYPFHMSDGTMSGDLPHERSDVWKQLAVSSVTGRPTMSGFVESYFGFSPANRTRTPPPMGFLTPDAVPVTRFLADHYAICDRWFCSLPTSTMPNRLMGFTGETFTDQTRGFLHLTRMSLLDWLEVRGVRWRVYHSGLSSFLSFGNISLAAGSRFREIDRLARDVEQEGERAFPQVILMEPSYYSAPSLGIPPNDNHPPLSMGPGEELLRQVYCALTGNPDRWARTMWLVYYDEHGGFFDHVPPPEIPYRPSAPAHFAPFTTLGPRVPALVVSPLVAAKTVYSGLLDHTSLLQLIAERFGAPDDRGYSDGVEQRRKGGIGSAGEVLNLNMARDDIPVAPDALIIT